MTSDSVMGLATVADWVRGVVSTGGYPGKLCPDLCGRPPSP